MTDDAFGRDRPPVDVAFELATGLRYAVLAIAATVLLTASLPRKLDLHHPVWPQLVAYGLLLTILTGELALLLLHKTWGRLRLPAVLLILGCSALSVWSLAPEMVASSADWAWGSAGWVALTVLLDRPIRQLALVLAVQQIDIVVRAFILGPHDRAFFLYLLAGAVGTVGFPLACGVGADLLRQIAPQAREAAERVGRLTEDERLRVDILGQRQERLATITASVEPLLAGLERGELSPADPAVQRLATLEVSRLRRWFAESDQVSDQVLHGLRAGADIAEHRGIQVQVHTVGSWSTPPVETRRSMTDAVLKVLASARTQAQITVIGLPNGGLSLSILTDGDANGNDPEVTIQDGLVWMEKRWAPGTQPS